MLLGFTVLSYVSLNGKFFLDSKREEKKSSVECSTSTVVNLNKLARLGKGHCMQRKESQPETSPTERGNSV